MDVESKKSQWTNLVGGREEECERGGVLHLSNWDQKSWDEEEFLTLSEKNLRK